MKEINVVYNKSAFVVSSLAKLESVKGVLCFGSYAMGTFDEYSDIDLFVFCEPDIVSASSRRSVLEEIEGIADFVDYISLGWVTQWCPQGDRFRVKNDIFDIAYNTTDWFRTVVRKVTEDGTTSIPELRFRPYTMLGLLENSIILHDPESFLSTLIASLYPYPSRLKKTLISECLPILKDSFADLRDCAKREIGNSAFHSHFQGMLDPLRTIIFALNEKYDPVPNRLEEEYKKLHTLPPNFLERYTRLLEGPFDKNGRKRTVKELEILIAEIEQLVDLET